MRRKKVGVKDTEKANKLFFVLQVGMGITPEAIEQNPVVYELLLEMAWRSTPVDPTSWLNTYASSRYGAASPSAQLAWQQLYQATYSQPSLDNAILEHR